jgi:hypothetical protein
MTTGETEWVVGGEGEGERKRAADKWSERQSVGQKWK